MSFLSQPSSASRASSWPFGASWWSPPATATARLRSPLAHVGRPRPTALLFLPLLLDRKNSGDMWWCSLVLSHLKHDLGCLKLQKQIIYGKMKEHESTNQKAQLTHPGHRDRPSKDTRMHRSWWVFSLVLWSYSLVLCPPWQLFDRKPRLTRALQHQFLPPEH